MAGEWRDTVYGGVSADFVEDRLRNLCDPEGGIQTGPFGSQLHQEDYVAVGTPIITVEHLGENRILHEGVPRVSETDRGRLSRYLLRTGDIVFSRVGSVDRRALVRPAEDGWMFSGRCLRVRPNREKIDSEYLSYFFGLPAFKEHIRAVAVGATMPSLNTAILSDVVVLHPEDLAEQRAIAHILGTLDDKIELNRRMNETLEAMARALFKSWFVDFDPVRAKAEGRDSGLPQPLADLFPARLVDSELGEISEGWELAELGDIADVVDCLHAKKPERCDSGYPFLQLTNIRDDGLVDMEDTYFVDEPDYRKWVSRMEATKGDCIITNVSRVGAVAQIPDGLKAALGRNMTGIRCKFAYPFPTFLVECLLSDSMRAEITRKMDAGTILNALNVRNIPKLRLVLADARVIGRFEQISRPLRQKMEQNLLESRTLAALRDALLPKLISGELRTRSSGAFVQEMTL